MAEPYSTAVYPYPAAMWDEAATTLNTKRGWVTVLLVCPDMPGTEATARQELAARGHSTVTALVVPELLSGSFILRLSQMVHIDPRWDGIEEHLKLHSPVALLAIDVGTDLAIMDQARAAMAERGLTVAVGHATDQLEQVGFLRIEKV